MKYLPSIILLFAVVIVHLFLFAHLSDAASQVTELNCHHLIISVSNFCFLL